MPIADCNALMHRHRIRHLPVVENSRVIGMLSSRDVLERVIAEEEKQLEKLATERLMIDTGSVLARHQRGLPVWGPGIDANQPRVGAAGECLMSVVICIAALAFLMLAAYRGYSVILFAPSPRCWRCC